MSLLQIYYGMKNNNNRFIFGEVMGKSLVSCFLTLGVVFNQSIDQDFNSS